MQKIAKKLIKKNPQLATIVQDNDKSYKLLEEHISTRLVAKIGRAEGTFIKRNALIWAIIDEVKGESEELDY